MLRLLTPEDVSETYLGWMRDPVVTRFLEARFHEHTLDSLRAWVGQFDQDQNRLFGMFVDEGSRHVGNATVRQTPNGVAELGYMVGDRSLWGSTVGIEALVLLVDHVFDDLGLRRIQAGAHRTNLASIFNLKRLGFTKEGVLRKGVTDQGEPVDGIVFGMLREEWVERRPHFDELMAVGS